ncbi:MAG: hypothetical protein RLZZ595_1336 [Bacteroidota bacterium]|jgi:hypothetical protein
MKQKRPSSHYILFGILTLILFTGIYSAINLTSTVKLMAETVDADRKKMMDPSAPDPGKTKSEKYEIGPSTKKVKIGTYLERIEDLDIKQSSWSYEFYLWFSWKPSEIDLTGRNDESHKDEIPFSIINGDILKVEKIQEVYDVKKNIGYIQYFVKAKNTQFFDVSLYPIDQHDLLIPIEHKWLDRNQLVFVPDTVDSKVSSRVNINGYDKESAVKLIEKPHAYKSARGNPKLDAGYKVDFSQLRMSLRIYKGGVSVILKLFIIMYIAVLVTFIAPFSSDPSRYTVGALFTTAGANYILSTKLPASNIYTLAEIINTFCMAVIIIMMALLAVVPSVIFKDGTVDKVEKRLNDLITLSMFVFFILINTLVAWTALSYS